MTIKFVYGVLPAFISYKEIDQEVKNFVLGNRITIEPKYECDQGILRHELEHVKQWYTGGFRIHTLRYKNSRNYRLRCEVGAYLKQTKYPKCDGSFLTIEDAAKKLTWNRYRLNLTEEEALIYLQQYRD